MVAFEDVVEWVEGRLDAARGEQVAAAVRQDPELAAAAAWLQRFQETAAQTVLVAPPPGVREVLRRRFATYRPPPPTVLQRIRAALVFDSATAAAAGVRSAATAVDRHLVLEGPGLDVAVDVYAVDDALRRVEGQLMPEDQEQEASGLVRLLPAGPSGAQGEPARPPAAEAAADPSGTFALPAVPPAAYVLEAQCQGRLLFCEVDLR